MARKPKLPIGDDLARLLKLALAGAKGKPKQIQANRIVSKLESKGNPAVSGLRGKSSKMQQQLLRGKNKRKEVNSIKADADAHMRSMAAQGKKWDGSPAKKATKPRKAAPKRKLTVAEQTAAAEREIANRANKARLIKKGSKAVNVATAAEAVGRKGTKLTRGGKEVPISKKRADALVATGRRATSQKKGGNAKLKAEQMNLQAKVNNAPDAASRRIARQKLRKHQDLHDNFLG
jgi:hypothetical protein